MRLIVVSTLIGSCFLQQAAAQDYPMPDFASNMQLYNTEVAVSYEARRMMRQANEGAVRGFSRSQGASVIPQTQPITAQTRFTPSVSRRKANLSSFVEKSRKADPVGAAKMKELFASGDIIGAIDGKMRETYGMRADNVADAYAVWWTSAWMGSQGRTDDPSPGQMAMVKRQAANALAATSEFASASDATKQEFAEALLVQAALIQATVETYVADPAMMAKVSASIREGVKASGVELETMTLTDEGFRPAE